MNASDANHAKAVEAFAEKLYEFEIFNSGVRDYFLKNPKLKDVVHSVRTRIKDLDHLREKLTRKTSEKDPITETNIFDRITDLAGVRVLHLHQDQFTTIHEAIMDRVGSTEWVLNENPTAYTWDPESEGFFRKHHLHVERKESFYTSIHYVICPRPNSFLKCEIQVRTLFEEIWGEVDHKINYPTPCTVDSCKEQILVLSKLVGAGSRLADSIFRAERAGRASINAPQPMPAPEQQAAANSQQPLPAEPASQSSPIGN